MQNRRLNFMYTKIAVAFADTKPTENAFGSNILSLRDWRRSFQTRRETQPMIASDATAQRAGPCRLDHPQLQLAGCDVRLCREPAARHRRLCQHGAARRGGGWPERGHPLFVRDFGAAGRLRSAPPPIAVSTLSRAAIASLSSHHPACAHRQQSAGRHHPRRHRLLARFEPWFQPAVGRQRFAWPGRALRLRRRALLPPAASGAHFAVHRHARLHGDCRAPRRGTLFGLPQPIHHNLSLAIAEAGGEIHKYVGDEIIATWTLAAGLNEAACVRACFAALDRLAERGPAYERAFGCRADFRAGLHCGSVVVGELGYLKKEIALIGDSMNTAARIQEACRATGCRVLASAALIERIGALPVGVTGRSLGPLPMRGKKRPISLYALETVNGAE